jgi:Kef-type K+ transport system membrane component KefB
MSSAGTDWATAVVIGDVAIILVAARIAVAAVRRIRQPPVVGEIALGILLGPSLLGLLPGHLTTRLFPLQARPELSSLAQFGLLLFMFTIGWELEMHAMRRQGKTAAVVGGTSLTISAVCGVAVGLALYHDHARVAGKAVPFAAFVVFLAVSTSITAFPVLARIIKDYGIEHTGSGRMALTLAAGTDLLGWVGLALVVALASTSGLTGLARLLILTALFGIGMATVVRPALARLFRGPLQAASPAALISALAAGTLLSAYVTTVIGIHAIFGAFIFGLVAPREPRELLERAVVKPIAQVGVLLMPVYFVLTGFSVDAAGLGWSGLVLLAIVISTACLGKIGGVAVPARLRGTSWRESLELGALMNTRGLTELIIINIGKEIGLLDTRLFTVLVLMALLTTAMTGPVLHVTLRGPRADLSVAEPFMIERIMEPQPAVAD